MRGASLMFTGETFEQYRQTKNGIRGVGLAMGAIVPEIDGAIEPTLIEGMRAEWTGRRFEAVERERIGRLADRALRWVRLRAKPNSRRRSRSSTSPVSGRARSPRPASTFRGA